MSQRGLHSGAGSKALFFSLAVCLGLLGSHVVYCQTSVSSLGQVSSIDSSVESSIDAGTSAGESSSRDAIGSLEPVRFAELASAAPEMKASDAMLSNFEGGQIRIAETPKTTVEQEVILEGLVSYGNYKIFASGYDDKLYTAGIEYDRHSWGHFLKANMDYVAEVLPFVMLDKPLYVDKYGNPNPKKDKNIRQQVYGVGISPIGFRWQWRSDTRIKPYLEAKGGMLGFTKKVPAPEATYENFSLQSAMGVQLKVNEQWGIRLGLFSDFHFSNAFIVDSNPGLDVMNANLGISYHF